MRHKVVGAVVVSAVVVLDLAGLVSNWGQIQNSVEVFVAAGEAAGHRIAAKVVVAAEVGTVVFVETGSSVDRMGLCLSCHTGGSVV